MYIVLTLSDLPLWKTNHMGAFHSTKNSEISGSKSDGTVKIPGKVFENLGIRFKCTLFVGISGIIENFVFHSQEMSGLVSLPSVGARTIQLFTTLQRNSSICFSGKIAGRPDKLPVGFRPVPVCFISCVNNWHVSQSSGNGFRTPPTNTLE